MSFSVIEPARQRGFKCRNKTASRVSLGNKGASRRSESPRISLDCCAFALISDSFIALALKHSYRVASDEKWSGEDTSASKL
ncbi:hypothetical protein TNCT_224641 [Trichonephila clavata]|uniref:Uncharacterized protein n=1 Tax=Trichonephila clavata TaxID=2740835 RepID=A0A8X6L303_TRICU|nr:hypothetical protein TNCT_224641 [Trichonephila clavata]